MYEFYYFLWRSRRTEYSHIASKFNTIKLKLQALLMPRNAEIVVVIFVSKA